MPNENDIVVAIPTTPREIDLWEKIHTGVLKLPPEAQGVIGWNEMIPYLDRLIPGPNTKKDQPNA